MAVPSTCPGQRARLVICVLLASYCTLLNGARAATDNLDTPVQPHVNVPARPDEVPATDAALSTRAVNILCYQFMVKALMAVNSDEEQDVADCLLRIHNA